MKKVDTPLISEGKGSKNKLSSRGRSFGYQVLGFGAGDAAAPQFTVACGGNATHTDGNFKIHVFTSPGTFTVTQAGTLPLFPGDPTAGPSNVDFLVVGGGGPGNVAGGGGGGMRTSYPSPGSCAGAHPIAAQAYPITIGGNFSDSVFDSITSTRGGNGQHYVGCLSQPASPGGAGGGAGAASGNSRTGGEGNDPPVSPPQGADGGNSGSQSQITGGGGGGGGASGLVGGPGPGGGGNGTPIATAFFGPNSPSYGEPGPAPGRWFGGGGGGSLHANVPSPEPGGAGGGGNGRALPGTPAENGATNTGGGGGGATGPGGQGGSGIVVIRYKFQ